MVNVAEVMVVEVAATPQEGETLGADDGDEEMLRRLVAARRFPWHKVVELLALTSALVHQWAVPLAVWTHAVPSSYHHS